MPASLVTGPWSDSTCPIPQLDIGEGNGPLQSTRAAAVAGHRPADMQIGPGERGLAPCLGRLGWPCSTS